MHISITGDLGSGKSTVGKLLRSHFNYTFISTGQIQRELGQKYGMNTLEFNQYTDHNIDIDHYIDDHLKQIDKGHIPHILDSRLAWFFVPSSFKVYLLCFEEIAASRIIRDDSRVGEPDADSVKQKIKDSNLRRKIENVRFEKNYGAIFSIVKNFDLVLDTSFLTIEQVSKAIISSYTKWKAKNDYSNFLLAPRRIYPLKDIRFIASDEAKNIKKHISEFGYNYEFPVQLLEKENFFYMYDGHKRLGASMYCNLPIIPSSIIASDKDKMLSNEFTAEKYIKNSFSLNQCYDWEDAHSFKYYNYPKL
ncbi:MAG: AAA family ATPase [Polaribacter sp.]